MRRLILAFLLLTAACGTSGSELPEDQAPASATTSTTITTSTASSTTTTEALPCIESLDDGRPTILEPTCRYTHRSSEGTLAADFDVMVTEEWIETVNSPRVMRFVGADVNGFEPKVEVIVMPSTESVDSVTDRIANETRSNTPLDRTEPQPAVISGLPGVTLDVFHAYDTTDEDPCGDPVEAALILVEGEAGSRTGFGPEFCTWTRVWIIDASDTVVVLLGGDTRTGSARRIAAEAGTLPDVRSLLEDQWAGLVNGITFCTQEAPCG